VLRTGPTGRRAAWATGIVGAGAVAALVSGGLMLASNGRGPELATPARVTDAAPPPTTSIVRLEASTSSTNTYGCGIVVAPDGLIATDATLLVGATTILATTSSGKRETATVVAVDPDSDVGLVRIGGTLPVARFVDWSAVQPGTGAFEMAVAAMPSGSARSSWWDETIASIGEPVVSGPAAGMVSVEASTPKGKHPDGAVLMESNGAVVGLLDKSGVSSGTGAVFLPGEFVFQVAQELMVDGGQVLHGWLGIKGADSGSARRKGAVITAVDPAGPSKGYLEAGDVIESINGRRVRTMADLKSRLYLLAPGSWVELQVKRGGAIRTIGLTLAMTP